MNYDLFIPPQAMERAAVLPTGSTPRGLPTQSDTTVNIPGRPVSDEVIVGKPVREEVSSDENQTAKVLEAVEAVNRFFAQSPIDVNLSIDEDTESLVIKLIERDSRKVIRQVPPEEILNLRRHLQELLGVLFDKTA